ncbi:MAG: anthranilate phosphoribosyltransferase [Bacteroidota bacterium]|jgi:anthranilate phosphoribosyltransferase
MKTILNYLYENKTLNKTEAQEVLTNIASGKYNEAQIASFLTVFIMRGITVEELEGFRDTMLNLCVPIDLSEYDAIDLCGTGGDSKDTFNISTLAAFVTAGAGIKVAKHGNYGVSSVSGSSNVIEYFGGKFTNNIDYLKHKIETANICFLHAPLFHPAMKYVAPVRKAMGVKTFFNMLGPMVNPANVQRQLIGVFSLELARLYGYLYQQSKKKFVIVHSLDGYDEISLTSATKIITNNTEKLIEPSDLSFKKLKQTDLAGGKTVKEAAKIFECILKGEGTTEQNNVVIANAAMAISVGKDNIDFNEAKAMATQSLLNGNAFASFKKFVEP